MADQGWEQVAAEAERLGEAATKGPWSVRAGRSDMYLYVLFATKRIAVVDAEQDLASADAAFIARARTLVPELAALVRQQAAEVARLRAREQEYGQHLLDCPAHPLGDSGRCLCGFATDSHAGEAEG